jgi:voltage-gated potassium channel
MIAFVVTLKRIVSAVREGWQYPELRGLASLVGVTLLSGSVFYSLVERWSPIDAFYFSVITLTTVGFGDFTPTTVWGKLFTACYIFVGVAIVLIFIDAMGQISLRRRGIDPDRVRRRSEDTEQ